MLIWYVCVVFNVNCQHFSPATIEAGSYHHHLPLPPPLIPLTSRPLSVITLFDIFILTINCRSVWRGDFLNHTKKSRLKVNEYWQLPSAEFGSIIFSYSLPQLKCFQMSKAIELCFSDLLYLAVSCDFPCLSTLTESNSSHFSVPLPCGAR